jgi:hypothetical protein
LSLTKIRGKEVPDLTSIYNRYPTYHLILKIQKGIDFKIKCMETAGKKLKMQIWDTAGQDRFESISTTFYKGKPFTPKIRLFTKFIEVPLLT